MNGAILIALKLRNLALAMALKKVSLKDAAEAVSDLADDLDPSAVVYDDATPPTFVASSAGWGSPTGEDYGHELFPEA